MKILVIAMCRNGAKMKVGFEVEVLVACKNFTIGSPLVLKALNSAWTFGDRLVSPVASRHESMRFVSMM